MKDTRVEIIKLPCFGIVVSINYVDKKPDNGSVVSDLHEDHTGRVMDEGDVMYDAAMGAIESMVLAHAMAGIDITIPSYVEGIEVAVEACANNF